MYFFLELEGTDHANQQLLEFDTPVVFPSLDIVVTNHETVCKSFLGTTGQTVWSLCNFVVWVDMDVILTA